MSSETLNIILLTHLELYLLGHVCFNSSTRLRNILFGFTGLLFYTHATGTKIPKFSVVIGEPKWFTVPIGGGKAVYSYVLMNVFFKLLGYPLPRIHVVVSVLSHLSLIDGMKTRSEIKLHASFVAKHS